MRLTAHQAADADLVSRVVGALDHTGLAAGQLMVGMPCGVLPMADAADFGLGPRDFAWRAELPVTFVLVPKDLVRRQDPCSAALVAAVHELGVTVCVDGVETAEQAKWWTEASPDLAIGAHFGSPLDAGEFLKQI